MIARMAIYPRLGSIEIPTRNPIMTSTAILTSLRRIIIRVQGGGLGRPHPNPRQIILTRLYRLTRMARMPRFSRLTKLPRHTGMTRLTSITSLNTQTILRRLAVMVRRTRLTRMVSRIRGIDLLGVRVRLRPPLTLTLER